MTDLHTGEESARAEKIPRSRNDAMYRAYGFTEYYCLHCFSAWFAEEVQECTRCLRQDTVRVLERKA